MVDSVAPLRGEPLFDAQGNITIRFAEFLDGMAIQVNESAGTISNVSVASSGARLATLQSKSTSGNALTSDETGFTIDSTKLTIDMTEA